MEFASWENLDPVVRDLWKEHLEVLNPPPLLLETDSSKLNIQEFNPRDVADLIYKDAVLASRVLAVANSAQFGLKTPLTSVQRAIVHLGFNLVKNIIMTYQMESSFAKITTLPREHLELVSRWSAGSAIFALHWAKEVDHDDPSTSSTLALLARLGTIVLGSGEGFSFEEYKEIPTIKDRMQFENDHWGITTPVISSQLVTTWELPELLPTLLKRTWEPLYKEVPADSEGKMLVLVCACDALILHYLNEPDCDPGEILERPEYGELKKNLVSHRIIGSLGGLWAGMRLQRDLAGATGG